jgi:solute carrier family 13 (sodium-dependent dicarboxylate transporter), member 2/3/5
MAPPVRSGIVALAIFSALAIPSALWLRDPLMQRGALVAAACLALWLSEAVQPFVPTLLLLASVPVVLGPYGPPFRLQAVLTWPADPVLALFLGGFALGAAAQKHGVDAQVAAWVLAVSRGRQRLLVAMLTAGTAVLSMWISNVAAAAMMLAATRPALRRMNRTDPFPRAALLGIALGANFGGMATPIGTGPNAIAIAAAEPYVPITFLRWMLFAVPLTAAMLGVGLLALFLRFRIRGTFDTPPAPPPAKLSRGRLGLAIVFFATVAAWLAEPLHGIPAPLIALGATAALFAAGLLDRSDLGALDWSTLGLIAGGVSLGRLIERTGIGKQLVAQIPVGSLPPLVWLGGLVLATALLAAVMSNTATVALLVPLAMSVAPSPSTAVLIAIAASFGIPFTISTPPNAMVYGEGGPTAGDLLWVGLLLMIPGCLVITLTGAPVLRLLGVP